MGPKYLRRAPESAARRTFVSSYAAPWITDEVVRQLDSIKLDDPIRDLEAIPHGVNPA